MEIKRIKPDELYHHGIKGQRWGVRRYQNTDGSLTSRGRQQYGVSNGRKTSTGKSKGVHRRGEGLGTGPVGRSDKYAGRLEGKFTSEYNTFDQANRKKKGNGNTKYIHNYQSLTCDYDASLPPNTVKFEYVTMPDGSKVGKMKVRNEKSLEGLLPIVDNISNSSNVGTDALIAALEAKGELTYDPSAANSDTPFAAFTSLSSEEQLMPGTILANDEEPKAEEENKKKTASRIAKNIVKNVVKKMMDVQLTMSGGAVYLLGKKIVKNIIGD